MDSVIAYGSFNRIDRVTTVEDFLDPLRKT